MKTLVTGANGLLGANLVRELLNRGQQVRAFVRRGSDLRNLQGLNVEFYYGDLLNEESVLEAVSDCDYVIHSGGKTPDYHSSFEDYARVNVTGTKHVVNAVEKAGIKRMVFVSSCCVFGGGSLEEPGTELSEFTGFKFNSGYINSKYLAQQWVLSEIEKKGLPIVIVNPTILLGPYDSRPSSGEIILRVLRQKFQVCPDAGKNFIDARDAAIATCNALTKGIPGESYLLASENLTFRELFERINTVFGNQRWKMMIPGAIIKCAGLLGNAMRAITRWDVPLNFCNSRQLATNSYFSAEKAVRELDLPQHSIDDAINDAISWFAVNGYLGHHQEGEPVFPAAA
ncbi:MAG: NAD-dependent epimerase/dehydratase family protein [Thermodesulfobacteriota bacterium]|nr:NAD-dependent epimerase/dehydratase family protein [Thermodesulfobacteriota bacterium]